VDFFAEQEVARRNTRWLVVLFLLAVVAIIAALYLVLVGAGSYASTSRMAQPLALWQPDLFLMVAAGVSAVIFLSSLYKVVSLSSGGGVKVAEGLGGRLVERATGEPLERRLLNIVDEMAIASGIPVPQVYVLEEESGINAFAAGTTTSDAVVAVTRGALEQLNRDELQGVVAHEFSHIFNGDMRLNIRLIGVLHGILVLALIGRLILRGGSRGTYIRSSSSGKGKGGGGIVVLALALMVIGYIGVFFGRLIKAAVSRQREFLADASAVQFTRNPVGLAGALKKIAGFASELHSPNAESASHMFFGNGIRNFFSLLATHPPVEERILRLDPYFQRQRERAAASPRMGAAAPGAALGLAATATSAAVAMTPQEVRSSIGNYAPHHLDYAHTLMERLPEAIWKALRAPQGAYALVLALVVAKDNAPRNTLTAALPAAAPELLSQTLALAALLREVKRGDWLPLLELAIPALEELPEAQLRLIPDEVDALISADRQTTLFEFCLAALLRHTLQERRAVQRSRHRGGIKQLQRDASLLFSLLVHAGHREATAAQAAFDQAVASLDNAGEFTLLPRSGLVLREVAAALENLGRLNLRFKGKIIEAATAAVTADSVVNLHELDLLRTIGAILDCPIPPLQVGPLSRH
jgi:Zn-dependent protease with chaperone function